MTKVMLRENIKFLDDVGNINLNKGVPVEVRADSLKDLMFKRYLFTGNIKVTEGTLSFQYKSAVLFLSPELYPFIFGEEYGKFFKKDVELDTITWINFDEMPIIVQDHFKVLTKEVIIEELKVIVQPEKKIEGDLNNDGKVDKADLKIVSKVLNSAKIDPKIFTKKKVKK